MPADGQMLQPALSRRGSLCALLALISFALIQQGSCSSVPEALQRHTVTKNGVTLESGLGWRDCKDSIVLRPKGTEEIADAIQQMHRDHTERGTKFLVRPITQGFMGHNNFSCPEGTGNDAVHAVAIDMSEMTSVLAVGSDSITVQAGISIKALEDELFERGLSMPGVTMVPWLSEMTVGAALATASHGSSLVGPSTLGPYLVKAVLVDGTGQIHILDLPGDVLDGSMGLLGVITEVTLETVPRRKVAVKQLQEEDVELVGDLREIIENSECVALDVTWSPAAGLYTARVWHETETESWGEARNAYLHGNNREWLSKAQGKLLADQEDLHDHTGHMCEIMGEVTDMSHFSHNSKSGEVHETDVYGVSVGWVNHMAGAHCPEGSKCFWKVAKLTPYELSISSEDFADWVEDVRAIMRHANGCPSFLFHFRFVMETDAPLAMNSGKQVVAIEITTHSARGSLMPVKHQSLFEEIVQVTLCKYAARPHWSLGTNRMFVGPCPLRDTLGADFDNFMEKRAQYDPAGLFVPPLFKAMESRSVGRHYPGCAVHGDCFCQEDDHCGPRHRCVPGRVFKEYNVCMAEHWAKANEEL